MVRRWSWLHRHEGGGGQPCGHPSVFSLTGSSIEAVEGNLVGVSQLSGYSVQFLVIGCYPPDAGGAGVGLTVAARSPDTGALRVVGEPTPTPAPSFVAAHPHPPGVSRGHEL